MRYASRLSRRVHELSAAAVSAPLDLLRQQRQRSDEMTSRLALASSAPRTVTQALTQPICASPASIFA